MKRLAIILFTLTLSTSLLAIDQIEYAKSQENIVIIETDFGKIEISLFPEIAPKNVANIIKLINEDYYNETTFHRVIPKFVIQGGDPNSKDDDPTNDGYGGPDYFIEDEYSDKVNHLKGTVALAKAEDDRNGSQFYICLRRLKTLDGKYTIIGQVINGIETVDKISEVKTDKNDRPLKDVVMKKVYIKEKEKKTEEQENK